ncbi:MAG: translation initiation factor IF-2 [Candidatus Nealsonbacteria bacterium]|nr:translation initiation factor IF-2 [Candidatus Nealsonbacteria bacterium]
MLNNLEQQNKSKLTPRPPIVVVLGHVDHGKSSILEAIKDFKITAKESGGITQHIGAYEVDHNGKKITFIDTPGHEAFTAMRSRGAKVADIAILVVAAEEGIKPQTKEAILHTKKAGIPMIVALNKIDKPEANPEKVKRELMKEDILVESLGGIIPSVELSAKTKKGIPELLELILLVGDMESLRGDLDKPAHGVVVESYLDKQRGPTATLLLRDGVLKLGDIAGTASVLGKIKMMEDFQGKNLEMALPSQPVIVMGLEGVPQVGEKFEIYSDIESAQKYIDKKERKAESGDVFLIEEGKKVLNFILKSDVQGSIEAIGEVLKDIPQDKVIIRVLKNEVGDVSESDVKLAKSGNAKILAFRVESSPSALVLAERDNVRILNFVIIYELAQAVRLMMEKSVEPEKVKVELGKLRALVIFLTEKNRQIVGGKVTWGEIKKGTSIEIIRDEQSIGTGKLINLQKNKKDANIALKGEECGILYEGDVKVQEGDTLLVYTYTYAKQG